MAHVLWACRACRPRKEVTVCGRMLWELRGEDRILSEDPSKDIWSVTGNMIRMDHSLTGQHLTPHYR